MKLEKKLNFWGGPEEKEVHKIQSGEYFEGFKILQSGEVQNFKKKINILHYGELPKKEVHILHSGERLKKESAAVKTTTGIIWGIPQIIVLVHILVLTYLLTQD